MVVVVIDPASPAGKTTLLADVGSVAGSQFPAVDHWLLRVPLVQVIVLAPEDAAKSEESSTVRRRWKGRIFMGLGTIC